jgi:hypothetical protein
MRRDPGEKFILNFGTSTSPLIEENSEVAHVSLFLSRRSERITTAEPLQIS